MSELLSTMLDRTRECEAWRPTQAAQFSGEPRRRKETLLITTLGAAQGRSSMLNEPLYACSETVMTITKILYFETDSHPSGIPPSGTPGTLPGRDLA